MTQCVHLLFLWFRRCEPALYIIPCTAEPIAHTTRMNPTPGTANFPTVPKNLLKGEVNYAQKDS